MRYYFLIFFIKTYAVGTHLKYLNLFNIWRDLVWDLPCVQQASYLEGGQLKCMLPLYVNQKSSDDDDYDDPQHMFL